MAFLKENVLLFLKDHADDLPPETITLARKQIDPLPAGDVMVADRAKSLFGNEVVANRFLNEIAESRKHWEVVSQVKGQDHGMIPMIPSMRGTANVLIVDDDPQWQGDLVEAILFADIKTTCALAGNGLEAQQVLANEPNVRVVITKLAMPKMDGLALTEWIKANRPGIVVILRSGTMGNSDRAAAEASGADHVLDKADNKTVVEEIRKVITPPPPNLEPVILAPLGLAHRHHARVTGGPFLFQKALTSKVG